jgi:hypothetical protein
MLYSKETRVAANIINVELQKLFDKKKVDVHKIKYSIDTIFQRIDQQKNEDKRYTEIPEEVLEKLKSSSVDYLLLLYDFRNRVPGGKTEPKQYHVVMNSNGIATSVPGDDGMGEANQFNSIYCKLDFYDLKMNKSILQNDIWADEEECDDEVIDCVIEKVINTVSEYNYKKQKNIPCWK